MKLFEKVHYNIEVLLLLLVVFMNASVLIYFLTPSLTGNVVDESLISSYDHVSEDDIIIDEGKIVIDLKDARLSRYDGSGSMAPLLSEYATGVSIKPDSSEEVYIGDVISFWKNGELIIHRVVEKGEDSFGVYFITKGDNNFREDGKVYFEDIDSVLVAVIY